MIIQSVLFDFERREDLKRGIDAVKALEDVEIWMDLAEGKQPRRRSKIL